MYRTAIELDREGVRVRVYHEKRIHSQRFDAGKGVKEAWTHPYDERASCVICIAHRKEQNA